MFRPLVFVLFLGFGGGCGGSDGSRVPVTGRVTLDGQPVPNLSLHLAPQGKTLGNGSLGVTDAEGRFTMTDVRGPIGAFVGQYLIEWNQNGNVALPKATLPLKGSPQAVNAGLLVSVPAGGCTIEIQLTKDGKPPRVSVVGK